MNYKEHQYFYTNQWGDIKSQETSVPIKDLTMQEARDVYDIHSIRAAAFKGPDYKYIKRDHNKLMELIKQTMRDADSDEFS